MFELKPAYFLFVVAIVLAYTPIRNIFNRWTFVVILAITFAFIIVAENLHL